MLLQFFKKIWLAWVDGYVNQPQTLEGVWLANEGKASSGTSTFIGFTNTSQMLDFDGMFDQSEFFSGLRTTRIAILTSAILSVGNRRGD
jgi:hypothetical protein